MDLAKIDTTETANSGVPMELRGPNGALVTKPDGSPVTIRLLGKDSDVYVKASHLMTNRILKQRGKVISTAEGLEADNIGLIAKCTVGWDGVTVDGEALPFSEDAARKLYTRFKFVREQVFEFIEDRGNFSTAS